MKIMKKVLALVLALAVLSVPMVASAATGAYDDPYLLYADGEALSISVGAGETVYVEVDNSNNSSLTVAADSSTYMVAYGRMTFWYPDANNTATGTLVEGGNSFSIYNNGEAVVNFTLTLVAGAAVDTTGTMDNPKEININDYFKGIVDQEFAAGAEPFWYKWTAEADGNLTVGIMAAIDADWNNIGWQYSIYQIERADGTFYNGDNHWSDDETPVMRDTVEVKAGDVVTVMVVPYNPEDMWNSPAGTISTQFIFEAIGSHGNPLKITETGDYTATVEENSQGYFYEYTATETGKIYVSINSIEGWSYVVSNTTAGIYGDTQWSDEGSSYYEVLAAEGDVISIMVNAYDPEDMWNTPAGDIEWSIGFETVTAGDVDNDYVFSASDLTISRKALLGVIELGARDSIIYDVNGDSIFDICDLVKLKKIVADNIGKSFLTPFMLYVDGDALEITVEAGETAYVQVDDCNNSILTVEADGNTYMVVYGRANTWYPDENNTATGTLVEGGDVFSVYNSGEAAINFSLTLVAGEPVVDTAGTMDNPKEININDYFRGIVDQEFAAGAEPFWYNWTATEDGKLTVGIMAAIDADWNNIGWQYAIYQIARADGTFYNGDNHWSDDDPLVMQETVDVKAGDVVTVMVVPYNPDDMWNAPAGTVSTQFIFSAVGSYDIPKELTLVANPRTGALGTYEAVALAEGNQGYYFTLNAPADGAINLSISAFDDDYNNIGWQYFVNNITASAYGDTFTSADETPVDSQFIPVSEGDELVIFVATYNPEETWNNPVGNIGLNVGFTTVGSIDYPEIITETGDYTATVAEGSQGYNYVYIATAAGKVTVTMKDASWVYCVNNLTTYAYGDTQWSDSDPVITTWEVEVAAGDEISIMVNTYDAANPWVTPAGNINWTLGFVAAE